MKLYFSALLIFLILINGCASEKHLRFLDIPINGTIDKFKDELKNIGFTEAATDEEYQSKVNGIFIEKNCDVELDYTRKSHTIFQVKVTIPTESRDSLKVSFEKIQKLCSSKYGIGKSKYYQYRNPERFFFNETRSIRQLNSGDFTRYTTATGVIILKVQVGSISITFRDRLNSEIQKSEEELVGV